jgi:predicted nucleic acid-binding protein
MTLILDSGGVSALARSPSRVKVLRGRGHWPPQIPAVVLAEALTGDHRRDFHENQLIRMSQVRAVTESLSRDAARLRSRTRRAATISATDAIVAALAVGSADAIVLTSDPHDLGALLADDASRVTVVRV